MIGPKLQAAGAPRTCSPPHRALKATAEDRISLAAAQLTEDALAQKRVARDVNCISRAEHQVIDLARAPV